MCGLLASYNVEKISLNQLRIVNHRGPDNLDLKRYENQLKLGHARLAIIDLKKDSHQPFEDSSGRCAIVFNGEIYNYLELKCELEVLGYKFRTGSDTEVLLAAYMEWGKCFLDRLNGMFAFIIYDKIENCLFIARDRFGIKPLYFYQPNRYSFVFASEIKQILSIEDFKAKGNIPRITDFISWRLFNHTNETLFRDVCQLRGGQYLRVDLRDNEFSLKENIKDWYSYKKLKKIPTSKGTEEENKIAFRKKLEDSVQLRLRSDVEIATALSGGIDSSSLACLVNKLTRDSQTTFSCRVDDENLDEFEYAKSVIQKIRKRNYHTVLFDNENIFTKLEELIYHNDEPVSSNSILMQNELFSAVHKNKFRVLLNGQGADEVFGTYGKSLPHYNQLKKKSYLEFSRFLWKQTRHENLPFLRYVNQLRNVFLQNNLYKNDLIDIYSFNVSKKNPHNTLARKLDLDIVNSLKDYNIYLLKYTSLPMLLQYDDRNSMAYSIESRVPFLDYKFVEFAISLPFDQKNKNGVSKYILREACKDILPKKIYDRRSKLGFSNQQKKWANGQLRDDFLKRLTDIFKKYEFLDDNKRSEMVKNLGKNNYHSLAWRLIMFDLWVKKFEVEIEI